MYLTEEEHENYRAALNRRRKAQAEVAYYEALAELRESQGEKQREHVKW
jgi:hypothetical protein